MREKSTTSSVVNKLLDFFSSKYFLYLTFGWFILQGVFFAIYIKFGIPPDENYHLAYIKFFADNFPSPFVAQQQGYDVIQEAVKNPFFIYHYLLSFPYKLVSGLEHAYILIRVLNIAFGVCSLVVLARLADFIKIDKLAKNLTLFMLANTLMFTFLFSSISYDNFFILLSLLSFLLLLQLLKKIEAFKLLLLIVVILLGALTKINFLPVAFIVCLVLIISYRKSLLKVAREFRKTFSKSRKLNYLLVLIIALLSILFAQRYIYNVIEYGNFAPDCQQIRSLEDCRKNGLFVRNEKVYASNHPVPTKNVLEYTRDWVPLIESRTYGIFAHKELPASRPIIIWVLGVLLVGFILIVTRWRRIDKSVKILIYLSAFYSLILLAENMQLYNASGRFGFAVHGRYLFCVLPIIYLAWNHLILNTLKNMSIRFGYVVISIFIFLISAFPVFIQRSGTEWYKNDQKVWKNER